MSTRRKLKATPVGSPQDRGKPTTVNIAMRVYPPESMFLRQAVGTAEADGLTWEMSTNVGGGHPIIRLPDGRWVAVTWQELIVAANAAGDATQDPTP